MMEERNFGRYGDARRFPMAITKVEPTRTSMAAATSQAAHRLTPRHSRAKIPQIVLNTMTNAR
jgi:hypothetical protein